MLAEVCVLCVQSNDFVSFAGLKRTCWSTWLGRKERISGESPISYLRHLKIMRNVNMQELTYPKGL